MGIFSWMKRGVKKLLNRSEVSRKLGVDIAMSPDMKNAVDLWARMYENHPPWESDTVHPLNTPAIIAGKIAKLVTIEAECTVTGSPRANYLAEQIKPLFDSIRPITEYACAKGCVIFKPYIDGNKIAIDRVQADRFFPVNFDSNGEITSGIFAAEETVGDIYYKRLEYHALDGTNYRIINMAFKSRERNILGDPCPLTEVDKWADIQPEATIQNVTRTLFAPFRMPFANNIDVDSPLGVSVYAKAVSTLRDLDHQYSRLIWEFEGGELAIHATEDLLKAVRGQIRLPEHKERLYRLLLPPIAAESKSMFEVFAPAFRDASLLNGFNAILRQIEQQCGLAFGTLSDVNQVEKTATETIHNKQESYSTVVDIQKALQAALEHLLYAMDVWATLGNLAPYGAYEASFYWDDSIIVDKEEKRKQFWQYVAAGKFPFWKFLVEFEGYTEEEARALENESAGPKMFGDDV